jgi:hypothetical protein
MNLLCAAVCCRDLNISPHPIDSCKPHPIAEFVRRPDRQWLVKLLGDTQLGLTDVFRHLHPNRCVADSVAFGSPLRRFPEAGQASGPSDLAIRAVVQLVYFWRKIGIFKAASCCCCCCCCAGRVPTLAGTQLPVPECTTTAHASTIFWSQAQPPSSWHHTCAAQLSMQPAHQQLPAQATQQCLVKLPPLHLQL